MTTTLKQTFQDVAEMLAGGRKPHIATLTGGGATTVVAANDATTKGTTGYAGVPILIITAGAAAPEGQERQVTAAGYASGTATWTVVNAWTAANPANADVALWLYGTDHDQMFSAYNSIRRDLLVDRYIAFPGLVVDGHMENSGTGDWTDIGTVSTAKTTTAGQVFTGKAALECSGAADGEGVKTTIMQVNENEQLTLSVVLALGNDTAAPTSTVDLYDETNSAIIKSVVVSYDSTTVSTTPGEWVQVIFDEPVPAGCHEVSVRWLSTTSGSDTTAWIDSVSVYSDSRRPYEIPLANTNEVQDIVYMPGWEDRQEDDTYIAMSRDFQPWPHGNFLRDVQGSVPNRVTVGAPYYQLYMKFRQAESAATKLTVGSNEGTYFAQTSTIPRTLLKYGVLMTLGQWNGDPRTSDWKKSYLSLLDQNDWLKPEIRTTQQRRVWAR
jgi:hypothetical protein